MDKFIGKGLYGGEERLLLYKRMYRCRASGKRVYKSCLCNVKFLKKISGLLQ